MKQSKNGKGVTLTPSEQKIFNNSIEFPVLDFRQFIQPNIKKIGMEFIGNTIEYDKPGEIYSETSEFVDVYSSPNFENRFYVYCEWNNRLWILESFKEVADLMDMLVKYEGAKIKRFNDIERAASLKTQSA